MIKKTVTYEDFDGNQITEELWFHITKSQMTDMELNTPGGWSGKLEKIGNGASGKEIMDTFKELILLAYGEKTENGRGFIKKRDGKPIAEEFEQSLAYDALYSELLLNPDEAAKFIQGIWPKDIIEEVQKEIAQSKNAELPSGNK